METELEFIMELNKEELTIETLKRIKERLNILRNKDQIKSIKDCLEIEFKAAYYPETKMIGVNYIRIMSYLNKFEQAMRLDIPNARKDEIRMLKILTAYRIFLHEMYHSKQIYNAYETDSNDLESELIRSIFSMDRKTYLQELKTKTRSEIMDERTTTINNILMPYSELNPIERKAEIESYRQVRKILMPVRGNYMNVYDELHLLELGIQAQGYDLVEVPYIGILNILNEKIPDYRIKYPYECKNKYAFFETVKEIATEQERLELGLNVRSVTKDRVYEKIEAILFR